MSKTLLKMFAKKEIFCLPKIGPHLHNFLYYKFGEQVNQKIGTGSLHLSSETLQGKKKKKTPIDKAKSFLFTVTKQFES